MMKRGPRFSFDRDLLVSPWIFPNSIQRQNHICEICKKRLVEKKATYKFKKEEKFVHASCYFNGTKKDD
jgi:hypothetical protein